MTDADVRAALRSLATDERSPSTRPGDPSGSTTTPPASAVVDDATAALDDVRATAAFVEDGGLERLRRAIERADRRGDPATARRGRDALETVERCRRIAADHFHSGRGTVLGGGNQESPR